MIMNGPEVGVELCTHFDVRATRPEQTSWERHVEAGESLCFHGAIGRCLRCHLSTNTHLQHQAMLIFAQVYLEDPKTYEPCLVGGSSCVEQKYGIWKVGRVFTCFHWYLSICPHLSRHSRFAKQFVYNKFWFTLYDILILHILIPHSGSALTILKSKLSTPEDEPLPFSASPPRPSLWLQRRPFWYLQQTVTTTTKVTHFLMGRWPRLGAWIYHDLS